MQGGTNGRHLRWMGVAEKTANSTHLQGLAGVHAVCSQLALRGQIPLLPNLDYGYDIMVDSGVRIQVKSSHLYMGHPAYPGGTYRFSVREQSVIVRGKLLTKRPRRNYEHVCDFFAFWGIEENRFFVVPVGQMGGTVYIRKFRQADADIRTKVEQLKSSGMRNCQIADELGISPKWVPWLTHPHKKTEAFLKWENRWDLLDVNATASKIVESVNPPFVLTDVGE